MEIRRGDVVICAARRRLRQAEGRQSSCNRTSSTALTHSVAVCLITSHLENTPLRIPVPTGTTTGLKLESQVMIDKVIAIPRNKITGRAGTLPASPLKRSTMRYVCGWNASLSQGVSPSKLDSKAV